MRSKRPAALAAFALAASLFATATPVWCEGPDGPAPRADGAGSPAPGVEPRAEAASNAQQSAPVLAGIESASGGSAQETTSTPNRDESPRPAVADGASWAPRELRAAWWFHCARLRELISDYEGARASYEYAIALGDRRVVTWRGLGRTLFRSGEIDAAEDALRAAVEKLRARDEISPRRRANALRELGELYLATGRAEEAAPLLRASLDATPAATRTRALLARAVAETDPEAAGASGSPLEPVHLWPPPRAERVRRRLGDALDQLLAGAPPALRRTLGQPLGPRKDSLAACLLSALLLLLLITRRHRKSADIVVRIGYPPELEGVFSVRLATRPGRANPRSEHADRSRRRSTRTAHFMVGRETQFDRLRPRRYWVSVSGVLKDAASDEVLTEPFDERSLDAVANETRTLQFDLRPRECPVDIRVLWDKRPARDAGVVARSLPQSLRYTANGEIRLRLPMGSHTIAAGSGDRVVECDVEVDSFRPTRVEIDLAESENLVFKGCPPAVEPYLYGDLNGAARALERDGHASHAHLLLARLHQEQGHTERAAEQLESAGHKFEAAKLRESISDFGRAGALFEDSGDARRAAESYRAAGEWRKAGELYESLEDLERAVRCYREAGANDALMGVLERQGAFFEAAQVAEDTGDRAASIRLLQQVGRADAHYQPACLELADAFESEGHKDLAAHKLEELVAARGAGYCEAEIHSRLADLLARSDEAEQALEVLEGLRQREPTYPHIASRIETLRKRVSARKLEEAGGSTAPTAFAAGQRYEILEEIGRGGMGVVFKARDRRLNRVVALKRLPENLRDHPKAVKLFLNEAQAAARLNHPNIVTIFDTDQEGGTFFITMELLEGYPLNTILSRRQRLSARDAARVGLQVARGLHYAHERGVIHRDIKTANLFVTRNRVLKIMDFGLAKMLEEVRRGSTVIGGTPFYMAPEQAAGESVDHLADIYALGITLFELVTGRVPFPKGDVTYHHRHTSPPDPRSLVAELPEPMALLILEMIRKRPEERCASSAEVVRRLEPLAEP